MQNFTSNVRIEYFYKFHLEYMSLNDVLKILWCTCFTVGAEITIHTVTSVSSLTIRTGPSILTR